MDQVLSELFNFLPSIVFSVLIWLIVLSIRKSVNWVAKKYFNKDLEETKVWTGVILSTLPALLGLLGALFITGYPFPEIFMTSTATKVVFGAFLGYMSGNMYSAFKRFLPAWVENKIQSLKS